MYTDASGMADSGELEQHSLAELYCQRGFTAGQLLIVQVCSFVINCLPI